jgi:predicted RNA binding protein YcfA (HicA-like mRNA interferase family)
MSEGLPVSTGRKVIKALYAAGFIEHHTTGSHVIMRYAADLNRRVTVPLHNGDLKPGTMRVIIKQSGLSIEEFRGLL